MYDPEKIQPFIVHIPIETHNKVKAICAFKNITMRQYILEAIVAKMHEHESRQ